MTLDTAEGLLSELLLGTVVYLDIPDELHAVAEARYTTVGSWLAAEEGGTDSAWDMYPQGSFLLGTVVRPIGDESEYDIDMVCRRGLAEAATTPTDLKAEVGDALRRYARSNTKDVPRACHEGRRCWTLEYGEGFHMDVLPAIPDPATTGTGIKLTDRAETGWLRSDPKAYEAWFKHRMEQQLLEGRRALAAEIRKSLDEVPEWRVKTTLQRAVQVLKRHRDLFFAEDGDDRPPSVLVTTLAARAYAGEAQLYEAVMVACDAMPALLDCSNGEWQVLNPVQPEENFADKWTEHPERAARFNEWVDALRRDLDAALSERGLDKVAERLAKGLGEREVQKSAAQLADRYRIAREVGALTAIGGLSIDTPGRSVPQHDFYGSGEAG
jgi:hypothetical protein